MDLGKRFKFYRNKAQLTQKEAAEKIGIKDYQLGNYETNRSEPSIDILKKMSQTYHVSLDKMLGNNWVSRDVGAIGNDNDEYIDTDELIKKLNEFIADIDKAKKK